MPAKVTAAKYIARAQAFTEAIDNPARAAQCRLMQLVRLAATDLIIALWYQKPI